MDQSSNDEARHTESEKTGMFEMLNKSPYHFTAFAFLTMLGIGLWYLQFQLEPRLERQTADLKADISTVTSKLDDLSKNFQDFRVTTAEKESLIHSTGAALATQINNAQLQSGEIKDQLTGLSKQIITANSDFQEQFAALRKSIKDEIKTVADKTDSTEQKVEDKLASMPKAENMVSQLDEQKTAIENTDRGVNFLKILVQLGIEHPSQRQALQSFAESNSEFSENPDRLAALWESRSQYTTSMLAKHLQDEYNITPADAMLLAYDELIETKPIRFFVDKLEIQSSAEPNLGAANPQQEESEVPLAKPLTITRVCAEMKKPTTECYTYFLNLTEEVSDNVISFESPSDNAVMKLIVGKHESEIPSG